MILNFKAIGKIFYYLLPWPGGPPGPYWSLASIRKLLGTKPLTPSISAM